MVKLTSLGAYVFWPFCWNLIPQALEEKLISECGGRALHGYRKIGSLGAWAIYKGSPQ